EQVLIGNRLRPRHQFASLSVVFNTIGTPYHDSQYYPLQLPTRNSAMSIGAWTYAAEAAPCLIVFMILAYRGMSALPSPPFLPAVPFLRAFQTVFTPFIGLEEAEGLKDPLSASQALAPPARRTLKTKPYVLTFLLVFVGLVQCLAWNMLGTYRLVTGALPHLIWHDILLADFGSAFCWLYTCVRAGRRVLTTVPYDLLAVYPLILLSAFARLRLSHGGILSVGTLSLAGEVGMAFVGMCAVVALPLATPSGRVPDEKIGQVISPEDYASLFSRITLNWVSPLIQRGKQGRLEEIDVWKLSPTMQSGVLFSKFKTLSSEASLIYRLWQANSLDLMMDLLGTLAAVASTYGGPFFMNRLLNSIDTDQSKSEAYQNALMMFLSFLLKAVFDAQHLWFGQHAAMRIRSELMSAIYEKSLKRQDLSGTVNAKDGSAGADTGKIVNLMSGDAENVANVVSSMHNVYGAPFEFILGFGLLYQILGVSAFSGFLASFIGMPLNGYLTNRHAWINRGLAEAKDKRMGQVNELLASIKLIKFFAWEEMWLKRAMEARNEEMVWRRRGRMNNVLYHYVWSIPPALISIISFTTYVALGNTLTIAKAFTALQLFTMIQSPLNAAPYYFVEMIQARIAINRIATFLEEPEVTSQVSSLKAEDPDVVDHGGKLGLFEASFRWNGIPREVLDSFELDKLSVVFPEGVLSVITGPTASGKTALLMALLGEMTLLPGGHIILNKDPARFDRHGNAHAISYVAQIPWLENASIRNNILFGTPMDEERYRRVLFSCALLPDLEVLEDGDETEIGAKGVSLSGGQKARVALARAVYARTKYVLLDDPLSAVDSHTGRFLYDHLLRGPLLSNRTVVLVTHHVPLVLPCAKYVVQMKDGRIDCQGTVQDLRSRGLLEHIIEDALQEGTSRIAPDDEKEEDKEADKPEIKIARKLVEEERRVTGRLQFSVYQEYASAVGVLFWTTSLVFVFASQLIGLGERVWIKFWGEAYQSRIALDRPLFYVAVYTGIKLFGVLVRIVSALVEHFGALNAARKLYERMLFSVMHATFRFHDTTPQGRLLNRFGRDAEIVDNEIAWKVGALNSAVGGLLVSVLTVIGIFPAFLVIAAIIGYSYVRIAVGYISSGRDLRRMESNSRSPIFSDFATLIDGIVTVRAFAVENRWLDGFYERLDASLQLFYAFWIVNRWLLFNFDLLGAAAVFATSCFAIAFLDRDPGLAGVAITSALTFSKGVYNTISFWTALELDLNSVERVTEYIDLPQEPAAVIESARPPAYWPSSSSSDLVRLENVAVRYAPDLPPVLRGVSFVLRGGERVGLVGRTGESLPRLTSRMQPSACPGSGKSTLATAILRFVDPCAGRILVDGWDISQIGTYDLRSRITFIPQDAALFSGTIRENLDPFGEHDDLALIDVLRRVQLGPENVKLDTEVATAGANFSQGQRQLVALARALLRRSSIVILDEATSSVDFETDTKIQTCIREEFGSALLITIAHRLKTIADYDKIVVLDRGEVVAIGGVLELMQENEIFREMCLQTGYYDDLEAMARVKQEVG
ncbi:unnamed protein product, partial [Mycena citricolor]